MRNIFAGYYRPSDQEFSELWQKSLFVMDTSVLLDLYRYSKATREQFFEVLHRIADRLWVPHQVALEFQDNRLTVITEQENVYDVLSEVLQGAQNQFDNTLRQEHPSIDRPKLLNLFNSAIGQVQEELDRQKEAHPDLSSNDLVRDEITSLLGEDGRVGKPYSQEHINEISMRGAKRYENNIPPGYKDLKDKKAVKRYGSLVIEEKFGDLVLWLQIIDKAKEIRTPIIFITSERKEDWWWLDNQKRTIGPRPELITEMLNEAEAMFYMYSPDQFVSYARRYLGAPVTEETINEVKSVAESKVDWKEEITSALRALGGKARLTEIYEKVRESRLAADGELPDSWQAVIRHTLQAYSSDCESYLGKEDVFALLHKGVWSLRSEVITLVESSPETLRWLKKLRDMVEKRIPSLEYGESKYYAFLKSADRGRNVVMLNPRMTHIRLFTRLGPSSDSDLTATPSTSRWEGQYPSMFVIRSEDSIEKAANLIEKSYQFDLTL